MNVTAYDYLSRAIKRRRAIYLWLTALSYVDSRYTLTKVHVDSEPSNLSVIAVTLFVVLNLCSRR